MKNYSSIFSSINSFFEYLVFLFVLLLIIIIDINITLSIKKHIPRFLLSLIEYLIAFIDVSVLMLLITKLKINRKMVFIDVAIAEDFTTEITLLFTIYIKGQFII